MNILFFKTKSEVGLCSRLWHFKTGSETMEYHKYASIPMLNKSGEYVGTITEGDLSLGNQRYTNLNLKEAGKYIYTRFSTKSRLCSRIN